MKTLLRTLAATALVAAGTFAYGFGSNGTFDGLHSSIAEAVAAGDPSAVKINDFIEKESTLLSQDFVTFSKVAKEAAKNEFAVVSEEEIQALFGSMYINCLSYGATAFTNMSQATGGDPVKAAKILAKYTAKQGKSLAKFAKVWGETADPDKVNLSKAAIFISQLQRMFELIDKKYPAVN